MAPIQEFTRATLGEIPTLSGDHLTDYRATSPAPPIRGAMRNSQTEHGQINIALPYTTSLGSMTIITAPEPGTMAAFGLGLVALLRWRRTKA